MRPADLRSELAGLFPSPEKRNAAFCLLLLAATLAVYNPVLHNRFINFDDGQYISENLHLRSGLSWDLLKWAFTTYEAANWHPLTWISHALDYQLFNLNPAGHHYVNVLLHALNAVLLFLLLARATGFAGRSLVVAALFALHPVNVESVAWAAERKNVLSMFLFLLALLAYGWYARKPGIRRYLVLVLLFALGLMAKPQVITLPFVLLLWDFWPLRRITGAQPAAETQSESPTRSFSWLLLEKLPLLFLSAASAVITMHAQRAGNAVRTVVEWSLATRLENAAVSYARYLGIAFWPWRLAPFYPRPEQALHAAPVAASTGLLLLLTVLAIVSWRRGYPAVGWFWFLGTLVPMIGLVQVGEQAMADRYAYLPFVGVFLTVAWGLAELARRLRISNGWLAASSGLVLVTLGVLTHYQIGHWRDSETLWNYTLQVTQRNFMAHQNLARELAMQGRTEEALVHFHAAEDCFNYDPAQVLALGLYEQRNGYLQDAISQYERALRGSSDPHLKSAALGNIASVYLQLHDYARAHENCAAALKLDADNVSAIRVQGLLAQRSGDFAQAIRLYSRANSLQPTDLGYLLLARALEQSGKPEEARAALQRARELSPDIQRTERTAQQLLSY
jgi:Flp pilus assembly protein TadD